MIVKVLVWQHISRAETSNLQFKRLHPQGQCNEFRSLGACVEELVWGQWRNILLQVMTMFLLLCSPKTPAKLLLQRPILNCVSDRRSLCAVCDEGEGRFAAD